MKPSPLLGALARGAARLYDAGAAARRAWYERGWGRVQRLPAPVVSVGNLAVGGTGKTPLVAFLARELQKRGLRVVILSRGYGGRATRTTCISDGTRVLVRPPLAGDEAFLLARDLPGVPVYTGRCRYEAGLLAWRRHQPDLFLLDDGLQHFQLHRDLELVLLDAGEPFGNGWPLPAGPLREAPGVLRRADFLVLTRYCPERHQAILARMASLFPDQEVLTATIRPVAVYRYPGGERLPLAALAATPALAFAGLARPEVFRQTLAELGARLTGWRDFPDHHPYEGELRELVAAARAGGAKALLTTAKDWARLGGRWEEPLPLLVLEVAARLEPWEAVWLRLQELVAGPPDRPGWQGPAPGGHREAESAEGPWPPGPAVWRAWQSLSVRGRPPHPRDVRRLLVRAPNWLGDAVMSLPVLEGLKRRFPGAALTVLAVPRVAPLYVHHPLVQEVWDLPEGVRGLAAITRRRRRFDVGVALPNSFGSALGLWLAGARVRAGYAADGRRGLLTLAVRGREALRAVHLVYYYLGVLRAFGELGEEDLVPPRLFLTTAEKREAEAVLGRGGPWVGLAPGAAYGPAKRWPAERFAQVARELAMDHGVCPVILGGPGEMEVAARVAAQAGVPLVNLAGRTTLRQALGALSHLAVLITNDSGLMHAAAALGVPVVAIFGSTDPRVTGPFARRASILRQPSECSPCLQRTCDQDYRCLSAISVAEVTPAARLWLAAAPGRKTGAQP
ncbi:MAG: tetraacyldisaccharide 4'-kinase [Syntrophobacterales bacterium]|nr:tetraacyldisaccharide 4'-kinase [Syntrophobacterales bacterium]